MDAGQVETQYIGEPNLAETPEAVVSSSPHPQLDAFSPWIPPQYHFGLPEEPFRVNRGDPPDILETTQ